MNATAVEEIQQYIEEFYDTLSEVVSSVQRHEDRLASHLALGAASKDRRHYDKIKVGVELISCWTFDC